MPTSGSTHFLRQVLHLNPYTTTIISTFISIPGNSFHTNSCYYSTQTTKLFYYHGICSSSSGNCGRDSVRPPPTTKTSHLSSISIFLSWYLFIIFDSFSILSNSSFSPFHGYKSFYLFFCGVFIHHNYIQYCIFKLNKLFFFLFCFFYFFFLFL